MSAAIGLMVLLGDENGMLVKTEKDKASLLNLPLYPVLKPPPPPDFVRQNGFSL